MGAEVSVGQAQFDPEKGEVHLLVRAKIAERRHDLEAHRLMDDWVEFWHGGKPAR